MTHNGETDTDDDYVPMYPTAADAVSAIRSRPGAVDDSGTKIGFAPPKPRYHNDQQLLASYSKLAAEGNTQCAYMADALKKKLQRTNM